ncbi:Cof subfamily protein (haloacid dehalogenase superfamily) [Virgibacillus natechei]|uniref:Cof subfamily protein (Haloacid dehalogenase superfamily) n=1 Tax=Virgibacillus natechei TaxID=1216297 RepID=A0ABS4IIJ1_9BACI|nr:HAD family hydrolase [Virgibacillus natechei]MBP1970742.1 Cof subfamily protein (haloacid dehalogenase superfamily) [Virgibacillus natechei]UZD12019.1 Cof-type HAD-IIB family hydrolase [Virgibacillus natechei]
MTYKALFLDIDGTILKPDHTYTDSTKDAILQAKNQGVEVFICTGRPLHEVDALAEELHVESLIGYNGAYAVYQNETIIDEPIGKNLVHQFIKIAKEHGSEIVMYTSEKNYFTSLDSTAVQQFNHVFQLTKNEIYSNDVADKIIGATVINLDPADAALYELETNLRLSVVNIEGVPMSYDIIRKNVNKGEAINAILKRLNIPKEQAIAFGDGMNDKEMLQAVGEGFAMENAHPDLFAYAKHTTTSVTESGIYNGLQKIGLVK